MAVSGTNLTSFQSSTDATSYATASITPTANYLVLASVSSSKATTPDTPTLSGNNLTWVQIATNNFDTAGTQRTVTLFRALGPSPTAGALTASFGGNTQTACTITVDQFSGADTGGTNGSGAIVQSATNAEASQAAATFTITLAAFSSANNATYGTATNGDAVNFTAGTGFTGLGASGSATPLINTFSEWRSDNDTTVTFGGAIGYSSGGIAVEIKANPISATNLTFGGDTDGNSTATTASVSPSSNNLLLLTVSSRTGITVDPNQPTVTGNSLTWVAINSVVYDTTGASRRRETVFRALGSSPTSGAISIDFGGQNQTNVIWNLDQISGMDTSGTNGSGAIVQSATNKDETGVLTSLTVTLSAFSSANNVAYGSFSTDTTTTFTAGTGFTILKQLQSSTDMATASEINTGNDTSVDINFDAAGGVGGIALEIKAAATTSVKDLIGSGFIPFAR